MNQILALREKRANLWNQTKAFLDSHRGEDGMVSAEDNATYEKMEADVVASAKKSSVWSVRPRSTVRWISPPPRLWFPVPPLPLLRSRAAPPMSTGMPSGA